MDHHLADNHGGCGHALHVRAAHRKAPCAVARLRERKRITNNEGGLIFFALLWRVSALALDQNKRDLTVRSI